ncbi:hypothetical protein VTL71DRAFT_5854 [Oculimacula yallundae]|uniref:Secreted protein n=1 Tax=Oculimacula yallundae TaxID=86028 RepID=A0ABR4BYT6_9HELO
MSAIMKTFFIALLAVPAILASPTPAAPGEFVLNDFECTCTNGVRKTASGCMYFGKQDRKAEWCHAFDERALPMTKKFTEAYCTETAAGLKPECRPVRLCQDALDPRPGQYQLC